MRKNIHASNNSTLLARIIAPMRTLNRTRLPYHMLQLSATHSHFRKTLLWSRSQRSRDGIESIVLVPPTTNTQQRDYRTSIILQKVLSAFVPLCSSLVPFLSPPIELKLATESRHPSLPYFSRDQDLFPAKIFFLLYTKRKQALVPFEALRSLDQKRIVDISKGRSKHCLFSKLRFLRCTSGEMDVVC